MILLWKEKASARDLLSLILEVSSDLAGMNMILATSKLNESKNMTAQEFKSLEQFKNSLTKAVLDFRKVVRAEKFFLYYLFSNHEDYQLRVNDIRKGLKVLLAFVQPKTEESEKRLILDAASLINEFLKTIISEYNRMIEVQHKNWTKLI